MALNKLREPVNGLTHLSAAVLAGIGLVILLYLSWGTWIKWLSLFVYGITLVLMFTASGLYHSINAGGRASLWLRKLDHLSIYLLIAGTYTPICLYYFSGFWQWGLLGIIWSMAVAGIGVKLLVIRTPRWVTAGIYLIMGWIALAGVNQIFLSMPQNAIIWLVAGGLFFSVGAIIYILKRPNFFPGVFGFHELWHVFVILGALSHFILIAVFIAPD